MSLGLAEVDPALGPSGALHPPARRVPFRWPPAPRAAFTPDAPSLIEPSAAWTVESLPWAQPELQARPRALRPSTGWRFDGQGRARGPLIGGCIEVMEWLKGTAVWPALETWEGAVLFLEISKEAPPAREVKRWLRAYGAQGILHRVSAVLLGRPGADELPIEEHSSFDQALLLTTGSKRTSERTDAPPRPKKASAFTLQEVAHRARPVAIHQFFMHLSRETVSREQHRQGDVERPIGVVLERTGEARFVVANEAAKGLVRRRNQVQVAIDAAIESRGGDRYCSEARIGCADDDVRTFALDYTSGGNPRAVRRQRLRLRALRLCDDSGPT